MRAAVEHGRRDGLDLDRSSAVPNHSGEGGQASGSGGEMRALTLCVAGIAGLVATAGLARAQTVAVGTTATTSDAAIFIADRKGYFRAEGLDVKMTSFKSAS